MTDQEFWQQLSVECLLELYRRAEAAEQLCGEPETSDASRPSDPDHQWLVPFNIEDTPVWGSPVQPDDVPVLG